MKGRVCEVSLGRRGRSSYGDRRRGGSSNGDGRRGGSSYGDGRRGMRAC